MVLSPRSAVLIPVKSFDSAKGRLADAIDEHERASLARRMAAGVIAAARHLPVWIVCDDDEVAAFAAEHRAAVLRRPARGLNPAVTEGVEALAEMGFDRVVIAHADLPLAKDLTWVADHDGVTIVPDRRDDGTNVMCVPTGASFGFAYGVGSAAAHRDEAVRLGLSLRVVPNQELGWDVDTPDDLTIFNTSTLDTATLDEGDPT